MFELRNYTRFTNNIKMKKFLFCIYKEISKNFFASCETLSGKMNNIIENVVTLKIFFGLLIALISMCVIWSIINTCYDIATSRDENRPTPTPYRTPVSRSMTMDLLHDHGLLIYSEAGDSNKLDNV